MFQLRGKEYVRIDNNDNNNFSQTRFPYTFLPPWRPRGILQASPIALASSTPPA